MPTCGARRRAAHRLRPARRISGADHHAESLPDEQSASRTNSERQFAKLLDFYAIQWDYERAPSCSSATARQPGAGFLTDFYLPAYDLYIEITTLNQKLRHKKNRKARRLVELHPRFKIKVLYQRDYLQLLVSYGSNRRRQLPTAWADQARLFPEPRRGSGTARTRRPKSPREALTARRAAPRPRARMVPFGGWEMPIQVHRCARRAPRLP